MDIKLNANKSLSIFTLVMINVIAIDSLRTLPISAEYGLSLVFYYLFATFFFFIPTALVSAELATAFPKTGGLYIWVKEAFGERIGFSAIWLQWIYNIVWYPTILAFVAATMSYLIAPDLANNKMYLLGADIIIFSLATIINIFGIRLSSWISIIGALIGTLIPMLLIIALAAGWIMTGKPIAMTLSWDQFFPDLSHISNLVLLTGVLFGLVGMEMSAVHAGDVKNPQRDYPRALFYSALIIPGSLIFASLAIALVIPQTDISLVSGLLDAFTIFFSSFGLNWLAPVIIIFMIIGSISSVSTWVIGPTRGLWVATKDSGIFHHLERTNRWGAPIYILFLQWIIFILLCSVFIFMPTVNSSYWILSALTAQLALLVYVIMFAAYIKLHREKKTTSTTFTIPGGKWGGYLTAIIGLITCVLAIGLGFFPPAQIDIGELLPYEIFLVIGMIVMVIPPIFLRKRH